MQLATIWSEECIDILCRELTSLREEEILEIVSSAWWAEACSMEADMPMIGIFYPKLGKWLKNVNVVGLWQVPKRPHY